MRALADAYEEPEQGTAKEQILTHSLPVTGHALGETCAASRNAKWTLRLSE
jgi:hypothetical protein